MGKNLPQTLLQYSAITKKTKPQIGPFESRKRLYNNGVLSRKMLDSEHTIRINGKHVFLNFVRRRSLMNPDSDN